MGEDPKTLEQTPVSPRAEEVAAPPSRAQLLEENERLRRELEEALRLVASQRDERGVAELLKYSAVPHVSEPPMVVVSSRPPASMPAGTSMVPVDQATAERLKKFKEWKVWAALAGIFVANLLSHLLIH